MTESERVVAVGAWGMVASHDRRKLGLNPRSTLSAPALASQVRRPLTSPRLNESGVPKDNSGEGRASDVFLGRQEPTYLFVPLRRGPEDGGSGWGRVTRKEVPLRRARGGVVRGRPKGRGSAASFWVFAWGTFSQKK